MAKEIGYAFKLMQEIKELNKGVLPAVTIKVIKDLHSINMYKEDKMIVSNLEAMRLPDGVELVSVLVDGEVTSKKICDMRFAVAEENEKSKNLGRSGVTSIDVVSLGQVKSDMDLISTEEIDKAIIKMQDAHKNVRDIVNSAGTHGLEDVMGIGVSLSKKSGRKANVL